MASARALLFINTLKRRFIFKFFIEISGYKQANINLLIQVIKCARV